MAIGFRVAKRAVEIEPELIEEFRSLPVANVSDCMARMASGGAQLFACHRNGKLVGPAITVKTRPGDNLMIHKAIDIAEPGDVIVVDGGADLTNALIGELMLSHAKKRGIAGFVIYGAIRDSAWIKEHDYPVFALGVTHRGPYKDGPGEVNHPIALFGMVIRPGDLILGDDDGVVSVPYDDIEEVLTLTKAKHAAEAKQLLDIAAGTNDRSWIDRALTRLHCEIES